MSLAVSNPNDVKVYRVGGSARNVTLPEWLEKQSKSSLKRSDEWRNRIELIQDFEFREASYRIKVTRDGKYAMASGVYKPQFRVFEFAEMSMKFEQHTDEENVDFVILSDDWTKSVHLQADRSILFYSHFGQHYSTRIPRFGRTLAYHYPSCDLLVGGASNELYRLNLEQGRFLNSLVTDSPGINKVDVNPANQLWSLGGEDGFVEFWDPRVRTRIARIDVAPALRAHLDSPEARPEISALTSRNDGLHLGVGTSSGHVLLYDLRHPAPRVVKDHQYGLEIRNITWHDRSDNVISADRKVIRMWNRESGKLFTSIEPPNDINDICVIPDSGLLFVAGESVQMHTYLVPNLGPAPKFASFLDNLTEEMAETATSALYDNYKFVTRKELKKLGLENVVGTAAAKAYMHGYFIDQRLYDRAKLIANPFAFDEYKKQVVRDKLAAKRASRIVQAGGSTSKAAAAEAASKVKVNQNLADKIGGTGALDQRFQDVFSNPEFMVDETSEAFKLINPSTKPAKAHNVYASSDEEDLATARARDNKAADAMDDDDDSEGNSSSDDSDIEDANEAMDADVPRPSAKPSKGKRDIADPILQRRAPAPTTYQTPKAPAGPSMVEVRTAASRKAKQTFATRVRAEVHEQITNSRSTTGGMQMSFEVGSRKKGRGGTTGDSGVSRGAERQRRRAR